MDGLTLDITGADQIMAILTDMPKSLHGKIVQEYVAEASECLNRAEGDAPVGETGRLSSSGYMEMHDNVPGEFYIDVGFGDGLPPTGKQYNYPEGMSTSSYPDGDMLAETYPWFVELGHMSRGGNFVAPQPFLGPNFDISVEELNHTLEGLV